MSDTPRTDALLRRLHDEVVRNNKDRVPMQAPFEQAIDLCLELEREHSKSGTEAVARWMISHGYTTGHGDDLDDLLAELVRQVMEPHKPGGEIPEAPYCDCPGWCLSKDRPKPVRCQGFQLPEGAENG